MIIKVLLIAATVAVLFFLLRHRQRVSLKAGIRVTGILLVIAAIVCIVWPDIPQAVADAVGVTRGTDLMLYVLIVVFFFSAVGMYLRLRELDRRVVELSRSIAIETAVSRDGVPGATESDPGSDEFSGA
ncbi:hypothetical protein CLV47_101501 [Antricoccus suffuscus]|uniref:DUF2304 domain-containing protein n=1 Tax=Antricoccus suffuscus TaxID=1629062 RepID=A0A2T1A6Y8_9ACTN|nr:DUF2304 domain-containing protein [Antricoccus suffuscus]PRZ44375.1 hypothetical protein CLV47_101501 [Antricoccus suffuscus]